MHQSVTEMIGNPVLATGRILDSITALGSIPDVLPTHYADAWTGLFTNSSSTSDMIHGILLQIPYILGF